MATVRNLIDKAMEKKILANEYASDSVKETVKETRQDSYYLLDYVERDIINVTHKLYGVTSDMFILDILDKIAYYTSKAKIKRTYKATMDMLSSSNFITYFNRLYAMAILKFNDATPNGIRHIMAYMRHIHSNTSMSNTQILTMLEEPQLQTVQKYFESLSIDELIIEASIEPKYIKCWHSTRASQLDDSLNILVERINKLSRTQKSNLLSIILYYTSNKNSITRKQRNNISNYCIAMQLKNITYKDLLEVIARNFDAVVNGIKFY